MSFKNIYQFYSEDEDADQSDNQPLLTSLQQDDFKDENLLFSFKGIF